MSTPGRAGRLHIRGVEQDRPRARAIAAALAAEGFDVTTTFRPCTGNPTNVPIVFVCSRANSRNVDFANEVGRWVTARLALIASFGDLSSSFLRNVVQHAATVQLGDWNGQDRSFVEFRNLVVACRQLCVPLEFGETLSLSELADRRKQTSVRMTRPIGDRRLEADDGGGALTATDGQKWAPRQSTPARRRGAASLHMSREYRAFRGSGGVHQQSANAADTESWLRQIVSSPEPDGLQSYPEALAAPKPLLTPRRDAEFVDASVFAPRTVRPGDHMLVQVFLHGITAKAMAAVHAMARAAEKKASRRVVSTLDVEVVRGQRIGVQLDAPDLAIAHPAQYLIWRGSPHACQFPVSIPRNRARRRYSLQACISIDGVPVGTLSFVLEVAENRKRTANQARGDSARRHEYAFISYATPDRGAVLNQVRAIAATGIRFFQDRLSLEPGTHWKPRLREEIERCDLFLLFWSEHAAKSKWVKWETRYALRRQRQSRKGIPHIRPMSIIGGSPPSPPKWLSHIHFHDPLVDHILAHQIGSGQGRSDVGGRVGKSRSSFNS